MKIRCRQCGASFNYDLNSGICPRCMEYNPREGAKNITKKSHNRFALWLCCFLLGSALVSTPIVYRLAKNYHEEWFSYRQELADATRRGPEEDFSWGETIPAGKYYLTPQDAFWMPEKDFVGLTYSDSRFLVIPVKVQKNEETPVDTELAYILQEGGKMHDMDYITYWGSDYWPSLKGYFPSHYSFEDYETDLVYLIFSVSEGVEPGDMELNIQESLEKPNSYDSMVTHVSRIPVHLSLTESDEEDLFVRCAQPALIEVDPGVEFDYSESCLRVSKVQSYREAGDFEIPEGMALVRVTIQRTSREWPYTDAEYTALLGSDGVISENQTSYSLDTCFDIDTEDIGSFYFSYNYIPGYLSEEEQEERRKQEVPETVSQFYLVDENVREGEIIFPGVTMSYDEGPVKGYWQIRIPVKIPETGGTVTYEQ